jgi:hypothetical protein
MTADNFCFYLQYRLIPTSQTGGQWYCDMSPFSIPCSRQGQGKQVSRVLSDVLQHFRSEVVAPEVEVKERVPDLKHCVHQGPIL